MRRSATAAGDFPVAEAMAPRLLSLPMFPQITDVQIDYVAERLETRCRERAPLECAAAAPCSRPTDATSRISTQRVTYGAAVCTILSWLMEWQVRGGTAR